MKFIKGIRVETDDFWYDLTDGGYIKPEDILLDDDDIKKVKSALATLEEWKIEMESRGILQYH
jgi:hypothetical protein